MHKPVCICAHPLCRPGARTYLLACPLQGKQLPGCMPAARRCNRLAGCRIESAARSSSEIACDQIHHCHKNEMRDCSLVAYCAVDLVLTLLTSEAQIV